jgi:hypothetical protein
MDYQDLDMETHIKLNLFTQEVAFKKGNQHHIHASTNGKLN